MNLRIRTASIVFASLAFAGLASAQDVTGAGASFPVTMSGRSLLGSFAPRRPASHSFMSKIRERSVSLERSTFMARPFPGQVRNRCGPVVPTGRRDRPRA